jgi:DNA-binding MarR family transcriptional regulator
MSPSLRTEIKQRKPFGSLEQEAFLNLARTVACLEHQIAEVLRPHGLTPTQYNALRVLRGAGEAGLSRNEIQDRLVARVPDCTRLLDRLMAMGFATRTREEDDRRVVTTRITPAGRKAIEPLDEVMLEEHRRQLGHLGFQKLRTLIALLEDVRDR